MTATEAAADGTTPLDGLVHARLLDGSGGARTLTWSEVSGWRPEDGLLWLHFDFTAAGARGWIAEESGLDPMIAAALLSQETRPRVAAVGDGLLMALRGVNLNPGADPEDMVSIRLWVEGTRIISTRMRVLLSVDDILQALAAARGPADCGSLLIALTQGLTSRMGAVIDHIEEAIAELEEQVVSGDPRGLREEIAALRRQVIVLRRYLAPQREAMARLQSEPVSWLGDKQRLRLREVGDQLIRHIEDLDAVRERAGVVQEELAARLSDQLNRRMYLLSMIAAVFLPLGFLTGLLGINVAGIPGADYPWAFAVFVILLAMVVAGQVWLFRRRGWF